MITESETTETEFSEIDELRFRGKLPAVPTADKKKKDNKPSTSVPPQDRKFTHEDDDSAQLHHPQAIIRSMPVAINLKKSNFRDRTIWTLAMLGGFITFILAGHFYCALLIFFLALGMVREIINLKRNREKDNKVFSMTLCWYFFFVATYYFYGKLFSNKLTRFVLRYPVLRFLITYHIFISFMLWIVGFLFFVLTLKKGFYRYQFRQFGWIHISIILIVAQTSAILNNVFEGLVWFILPALLVICNDIFAYIFGMMFGRTPLIELSPKKTWEGFIGGFISTLIAAFVLSYCFIKSEYLICPQTEFELTPFQFLHCEPSTVFEYSEYALPNIKWLGFVNHSMTLTEFHFHAVIIALFVSLVSPFGGFFASGFKRAIKVKDFADVIPGHGGITDRMDCQIITGTFAYLYVDQVVMGKINYLSGVTRYIMTELSTEDQLAIYLELEKNLMQAGMLNVSAN